MRPSHVSFSVAACSVISSFALSINARTAPASPSQEHSTRPAVHDVRSAMTPATLTRVGCFHTSSSPLVANGTSTSPDTSRSSCATECESKGLSSMGVSGGVNCRCGYTSSDDVQSPGDDRCDVPCAGDATETCGGADAEEVFRIGETSKRHLDPRQIVTSPKYVVAHHMVGNTFPYGLNDWVTDMTLARTGLIDGFALNVGADSWQPARVADAFTAANTFAPPFYLFFSFDVTSLPCGDANAANTIRSYIAQYAANPAHLKDGAGSAVVSTFAGEYCNFGTGDTNSGWYSAVKAGLPPTTFIPAFFGDPNNFGSYPVMDGDFYWDGGWPLGDYSISFDRDNAQIAGLSRLGPGKLYMAAVSPWFFTHYGPDSYNKNWIYKGDDHLYPARWDTLIQNRDRIFIAEIISWNDYGESHYIGRVAGAQPNSQAWVDGFDHTAWLEVTRYYAQAFKTGIYPSSISQDRVFLWARPHSKNANAPDYIGKPNNWEWTDDFLWAFVLATSACTLTLTSGANTGSFDIPSGGAFKFQLAQAVGGVSASISRAGIPEFNWSPPGFQFIDNPQTYNFNAYVAVGP